MKEQMPLISIITVSFNAEGTIGNTIESVLKQTYPNLELIIKDGKSTDGTRKVIESYRRKIEEKGILFQYVSEPDQGIYDAMNEAIKLSHGDWLCFMNANDQFYNGEVIKEVFEYERYDDYGVLYGNTLTIMYNGAPYISGHDHTELPKGMGLCHQSCFIRGTLMKEYGYDCTYKISADYDFFLKLYLKKIPFKYLNKIIARYSREGVSSYALDEIYAERIEIQKKYHLPCKDLTKTEILLNKVKTWICKKFPAFSDWKYCINRMKAPERRN